MVFTLGTGLRGLPTRVGVGLEVLGASVPIGRCGMVDKVMLWLTSATRCEMRVGGMTEMLVDV